MRRAREEAEAEVNAYREARQQEFQDSHTQVCRLLPGLAPLLWQGDDTAAKFKQEMDKKTEERIKAINHASEQKQDAVVDMLLKAVRDIDLTFTERGKKK